MQNNCYSTNFIKQIYRKKKSIYTSNKNGYWKTEENIYHFNTPVSNNGTPFTIE